MSGWVVVPCADLDATCAFLTWHGFALERLLPADDPQTCWLTGHGLRLRLERGADVPPPRLRIEVGPPGLHPGPDGLVLERVAPEPDLVVPACAPAFAHQPASDDAAWVVGRAGMRYRDLVPGRLGGWLIASHIAIPEPGPVPDRVHYHLVGFQLIHCLRGWVEVVYQDQGPPFRLEAGDCVLQPPGIRHRVLEGSGGLEVLEVGCPAVHATCFDDDLELPTDAVRPGRDFGGQRFARHVARETPWTPAWRLGFEQRATGLGAASGGRVDVASLRAVEPAEDGVACPELLFGFVLAGAARLTREGAPDVPLAVHDAFVLPPGTRHALRDVDGLELLEVRAPLNPI